ncbi:hypothetical protein ACXYMU_04770 [Pontibacter sp. CAU 1760]
MTFKTAYESAFYRIEVDVRANLLKSVWLRPASEEEIRTGGMKLYEVLRDTKVEFVLANATLLGVLTAASKEWLATKFYEMLSQTNLKKLARVLPEMVFHRIALESVVTRAEAMGTISFLVKNFSGQADAMRWLHTSHAPSGLVQR